MFWFIRLLVFIESFLSYCLVHRYSLNTFLPLSCLLCVCSPSSQPCLRWTPPGSSKPFQEWSNVQSARHARQTGAGPGAGRRHFGGGHRSILAVPLYLSLFQTSKYSGNLENLSHPESSYPHYPPPIRIHQNNTLWSGNGWRESRRYGDGTPHGSQACPTPHLLPNPKEIFLPKSEMNENSQKIWLIWLSALLKLYCNSSNGNNKNDTRISSLQPDSRIQKVKKSTQSTRWPSGWAPIQPHQKIQIHWVVCSEEGEIYLWPRQKNIMKSNMHLIKSGAPSRDSHLPPLFINLTNTCTSTAMYQMFSS